MKKIIVRVIKLSISLIFLFGVGILINSCTLNRELPTIPKSTSEWIGFGGSLDFTSYVDKGFTFTPKNFTEDDIILKSVSYTHIPERIILKDSAYFSLLASGEINRNDFQTISVHQLIIGEYEGEMRQTYFRLVKRIDSSDILDLLYKKSIDLGGNGFSNLKIDRKTLPPYSPPSSSDIRTETRHVSGWSNPEYVVVTGYVIKTK